MLETKFRRFEAAALADPERRARLVEEGRFDGYAALFDAPDADGDVIAPGAFAAGFAGGTAALPKLLWQHDPAQPIGVWEHVQEDARGLYVSGRLLLDLPTARDAALLIAAGALDGLSIGYRTIAAERQSGPAGPTRRLTEIALWEISVVTFPMQPDARVRGAHPPATQARRALSEIAAARQALTRTP
ncbi:MAG: HK97 family phage prohead protease [Pseudomonadota bacterium]